MRASDGRNLDFCFKNSLKKPNFGNTVAHKVDAASIIFSSIFCLDVYKKWVYFSNINFRI